MYGYNNRELEQLRERLQRMPDAELMRFSEAAAAVRSSKTNGNAPPRDELVVKIKEARNEWKRRHPRPEVA